MALGRRFGCLAAAVWLMSAAGADAAVPAECPGPVDPAFGAVQSFTGSFDASLEGSYVQVPFDVPAGSTGVRVRYCFDQPDAPAPNGLNANTLDLGVYEPLAPGNAVSGPDEIRGWSGGAIRDATIAVNGFSDEATYEADPKGYVSGRTTRGYQPGPIPAGEWNVELGLAAISTVAEGNLDNAVAWRVDVQTTSNPSFANDPYSPVSYDESAAKAGAGWYSGDFHVHGEEEPGNALMRETFDYAFSSVAQGGAGLDFVQLVDHNNTVAHGEIGRLQPDYPDNLIARGTEVTTYRGHLNVLGADAATDFRTGPIYRRQGGGALTQERTARAPSEIFDQAHAAGGYAQINHPTIFPSQIPLLSAFCRGCPWDYTPAETDYSKVDAIEVQTGPPGLDQPPRPGPNPFTPLALGFWDRAIDSGGTNKNHIAATGSSDSHQAGDQGEGADSLLASPIGEATTVVYAGELSEDGVQDGVEAAHTYVKPFGVTGPDVRLEASESGSADPPAMIGDTLESQTGFSATLDAKVLGLERARAERPGAYYVVVYRDTAPVLVQPIPPGDEFEFSLPTLGYARYRLQVQREGSIETVSSPIWIEPKGGVDPPDPPDTCKEAPRLRLSSGDDRFGGTPGPDRAAGRRGADRMRGGEGDDCLSGGRGRDRLRGDGGADRLSGGGRSDRIDALDGEADRVRCGQGRRDKATVDRGLDEVSGCERLKRLAA